MGKKQTLATYSSRPMHFRKCQRQNQGSHMLKIVHYIWTVAVAGFEPTNTGVKVLCLTTWRYR